VYVRVCVCDLMMVMLQMVSVGLCGVFELLRETQASQPVLCHRALLALFSILQAQSPEGLRSEPADIVGMGTASVQFEVDWLIASDDAAGK